MSFSVNGIAQTLPPLEGEGSLGDFLKTIRDQYSSPSSCISSIRVDDQELSAREEAAIALLPLSDLQKIEITTQHPQELAQEMLQDLITFVDYITTLSQQISELFNRGEHPSPELAKLFDGIRTFSDGIESAKRFLMVPHLETLHILEADLLSITQDLLASYHQDDQKSLMDLLKTHLPDNLEHWRKQGLPLLMRARDN